MKNPNNNVTYLSYLSEEIVTEILARLPLRIISRFKMVCRTWKSTLESLYFRRLFLSLHQNKSRSWSQVCNRREFMLDVHRCQTWGLPKSLGYYFQNIFKRRGTIDFIDSSNGLVLIDPHRDWVDCHYCVGNPVLQQWVVIPDTITISCMAGLVTRVDEDGVVLSFKVVKFVVGDRNDTTPTCMKVFVYSSETGIWTCKQLHRPHYFTFYYALFTLHGKLYLGNDSDVIIAHDFYGESNVCRVIPLPDHDSNNDKSLTTTTEFVVYMKTVDNNVLKVWRLVDSDDDNDWELMWKTHLQFIPSDDNIISYEPLIMHPFDRNIVYLWSLKNNYLVSCNLRTQNYHIFIDKDGDLQNCFVNHSVCEKDLDGLCALYSRGARRINYIGFEYVVPRWMGSIPYPPRAEITSLLAQERINTYRVQCVSIVNEDPGQSTTANPGYDKDASFTGEMLESMMLNFDDVEN